MPEYFLQGSTFRLIDKLDTSNKPSAEEYMLAVVYEEDYVLQIICITGYHAGSLCGYVHKDQQAVSHRVRGVSHAHLLKEVQRNFVFVESSFEIVRARLAEPLI